VGDTGQQLNYSLKMARSTAKRLFRFGIFEADEQTGELRKQGRRLALQGQPLQVLLMLLSRPGDLVTRAEIRERLWAEGTFVDFDHGLNTAVNKIRDALGDSAANQRFIETLARRGYRFIVPVEIMNNPEPADQSGLDTQQETLTPSPPAQPPIPSNPFTLRILTTPEELPQASRPLVRTLFFLLQLMYLCFYIISLARLSAVEEIVRGIVSHAVLVVVLLVVTAVVGIPTRLYLISALAFNAPGLREKFLRIFPVIFPLDAIWALAPFLLTRQIGFALALGITAALLYVPFTERSLILMGAGSPTPD
jgi:DNA-binding winged helix-turn-helix (wHTH) protein